MKLSWKNTSLQVKIFITCFLAIACFVSLVFGLLIPSMKESLMKEKRLKLQEMVDVQISMLNKLNDDAVKEKIKPDQAQKTAINLVKNIRYGSEGKDYFWINDFGPKMIVHPFRADLNGKDISDFADPNGKHLFVEMVNVCKQSGHGFVDYMWQWKDDAKKIVPKISYVKEFKPWGWIIGTGIYIEDVNAEISSLYVNQLIIFAVITFTIILIVFIIARAISKPVKKILTFASDIASGDLTQRIKLAQNDEFGKLGKALNDAADNLEKLTTETIMASRNLMQAIDEITNGNQDLSQRTSEQASSLEEIASTVEEAATTIKNNADNAQEANLLSGDAIRMAEEGRRIVVEAVTAINEMSVSSKRIGEIISVINEIAFQTNLLALNAAVEAARAGEQGRGFAVVASEVRNLAQRAGSAAKEIGGLIKDSIEKVENSTMLANKSGAALKDIIESINKVGKLISEIAAASEEHKQGIDQINSSVVELDTMTQQNSALVEETASSSEEMANQAQELVHMLERFKAGEEYKEDPSEREYRNKHNKALAQEKNNKIVVKQNRSTVPKTLKKENARDGKDDIGTLLADEGFEKF